MFLFGIGGALVEAAEEFAGCVFAGVVEAVSARFDDFLFVDDHVVVEVAMWVRFHGVEDDDVRRHLGEAV